MASQLRRTWAWMAAIIFGGSAVIGVLAHAVGAGMTVVGLGAIGFTMAVFWADWANLLPSGGLGTGIRRMIWLGVAVCTASLLLALGLFLAHVSSTGALVVAFAAAMLFGGTSLYAAVR